jgi:hypothetical protein
VAALFGSAARSCGQPAPSGAAVRPRDDEGVADGDGVTGGDGVAGSEGVADRGGLVGGAGCEAEPFTGAVGAGGVDDPFG